MSKKALTKAEAMVIVEEARALGIAFVEDDTFIDSDGNEIYNPTVDRPNAEAYLLDKLMSL